MSENTIEYLLDQQIKDTLSEVASLGLETDEKGSSARAAMTKFTKLHDQRIKEREIDLKEKQLIDQAIAKRDELEIRDKELELTAKKLEQEATRTAAETRLKEQELDIRQKELKESKASRRWHTALEILGITVPAATTVFWLKKGLQFDEEGKIYSSRTPQWLSGITRLFKK